MNCPYCDETVHLMSKFCPKCGLPLKEDATVMGAYASDDTGPSMYVVGGGAAAVLIIALLIGWLSSRQGNKPVEQVQRQQLSNPAFSMPAVNPAFGAAPVNPAYGLSMPGNSKSADYTPQVKWAHTPTAAPEPVRQPQFVAPEPRGPEAPPHLIAQQQAAAPKPAPRVEIARATEPALPAAPSVPPPMNLLPGQVMPEQPAIMLPEADDGLPRLTPEARQLERDGVITYDPVQERYVLVPGARRRTNPNNPPRIKYIAPGNSSPMTIGPANSLRPVGAGE
jgi:hypothetical protein